jgi:dTDP-L-rhamnose 4-epimerase
MNILITGGAGFIGSQTALKLLEYGHKVRILDNFSVQVHGANPALSYSWRKIADSVDLIQADIRDRESVAKAINGMEVVLHLAAETGTGQSMYEIQHYADVNVMGSAVLLEAISQNSTSIRKIVVASSRSIYGEGLYTCSEHGDVYPGSRSAARMAEGHFEPRCPVCDAAVSANATPELSQLSPASVYAVTKLAQENLFLSVARSSGISVSALRYQNVFGEGQSLSNPYTGILSIFSRELLAGRSIEIFEDGLESRDFIHVDDVATANKLALEDVREGATVLNVGTGRAVSVIEVARQLQENYQTKCQINISGRYRAGDIRHNYALTTEIEAYLGFKPLISFEEGLSRFCRWAAPELDGVNQSSFYIASLQELETRGLIGISQK